MKSKALLALALAALAAGCSKDTSGIPRGAYLDELTSEQLTILCAWSVQKQGGSGAHTCSWGTRTIVTIDACAAKAWPHCPVSLFEDCLDSLSDVCDQSFTGECSDLQTCTAEHPAPDAGLPADAGG